MKDINILVFGDSITYGAWDSEKAGWVNRLRLLLERTDVYYNIFNLGIPGDTTGGIKERFNYECGYRYNVEAHTIIIFSIGVNDSYVIDGKNNVSIEKFKANIVDLISMAKKYTEDILFVGLSRVDEMRVSPLPWDSSISYFNDEIIKFNEVLEEVCRERKISYLDVFDLLGDDDLEDGLHPNGKGHKKLCDEILMAIRKKIFLL